MKILVYDETGCREWRYFDNIHIVSTIDDIKKYDWDIVFIHASDYENESSILGGKVRKYFEYENIVQINAKMVFFSGGNITEEFIKEIKNKIDEKKINIYFHNEIIIHKCSIDVLGGLIKKYSANTISTEGSRNSLTVQYRLAFKLLLQVYIISKIDSDITNDLSSSIIKQIKERISLEMNIDKEFWGPILNEEGTDIHQQLKNGSTDELSKSIEKFSYYLNNTINIKWDCIPESIYLQYQNDWIKSINNHMVDM